MILNNTSFLRINDLLEHEEYDHAIVQLAKLSPSSSIQTMIKRLTAAKEHIEKEAASLYEKIYFGKTNIKIVDTDEKNSFKDTILYCIRKILNKTLGQAFFKKLLASPNLIEIHQTKRNSKTYFPIECGTRKKIHILLNPIRKFGGHQVPVFTELFHELIHADHMNDGTDLVYSTFEDPIWTNMEERYTCTGRIPGSRFYNPFNENNLLWLYRFPLRQSH